VEVIWLAASIAVLDIIESQNLMENARNVEAFHGSHKSDSNK
jgi:4-aminobutyrate aminotransferase-like enzyme